MIVTMEHIATGKTIEDAINAGCDALGRDRDSVSVEVLQTPSKGFLFGFGAQEAKVRLTYEVDMPDPKPAPRAAREKPAPRPQPPKPEPGASPREAKAPPAPKPQPQTPAPFKAEQPSAPAEKQEGAQGPQKEQPRKPQPKGDSRPKSERKPEPRAPKPAAEPVEPARPFEPVSGTRAEAFLQEIFSILELPVNMSASSDGTLLRISLEGDNMGLLIGRRGETLDALQYLTGLVAGHGDERFSKVSLDIENYRAKREEALISLANKVAEKVRRLQKSVTLEPMNPYERRIIHSALQDVEGVETGSIGHEPTRRVVVSPAGSGGPRSSAGNRSRKRRRKPQGARPAANAPNAEGQDTAPSVASDASDASKPQDF